MTAGMAETSRSFTSVALCTHNGAKYVREQLRSILVQARPVDEIVISDDTLGIVHAVLDVTSAQVRVLHNDPPLGVARNFE